MVQCEWCHVRKASLRRPKTGSSICKDCFYEQFENEIHQTIITHKLFKPGQKIAIAASGGKDSTVLAHTMSVLNEKYKYGLQLFLLSVDEGITGYRDDSLETVKRNKEQYSLPLQIVSYRQLYGWTMDSIVKEIGRTNNCTFCGVFRRQALDRGAALLGADMIVTGHNADDMAETVLMNLLRGDIARLNRCVDIVTGRGSTMPRSKPFKYTYEKEIVMYAYYKGLDYFSTECIYSPFAYRGYAREFLKELEATKTRSIIDIIRSAEHFNFKIVTPKTAVLGKCVRCGYMSSQTICKACALLARLNAGKPKVDVKIGDDRATAPPLLLPASMMGGGAAAASGDAKSAPASAAATKSTAVVPPPAASVPVTKFSHKSVSHKPLATDSASTAAPSGSTAIDPAKIDF